MLEMILPYATAGIGILVTVILLVFIGKVMYKKAPPNVAMVITGPVAREPSSDRAHW